MVARSFGLAALWVIVASSATLGGPIFQGLGFLDASHPYSEANAISDDGSTVPANSGDLLIKVPAGNPLPPGLVALYNFDGGTVADSSGHGYDGTLMNGDTIAGGVLLNNAATGGYVQLPEAKMASQFTNAGTLMAWVKLTNATPGKAQFTGFMGLGGTGNCHYTWVDGRAYITTFRTDGSRVGNIVPSGSIDRSQWHLVTVTSDPAGGWNMYQNTTLIMNTSAAFGIDAGSWTIGTDITKASCLDGRIDNVMLFNRALSPSEIAAIFAGGQAAPALLFRKASGLVSSLIPGFSHVGFFPGGNQKVWESIWVLGTSDPNPLGLDTEGEYWDPDGLSAVHLSPDNGVQQQHTAGSWRYAAKQGNASPVTDFRSVTIDSSLAQKMSTWIAGKSSATYSVLGLVTGGTAPLLSPLLQKGYLDGFSSFTCVGLTEAAAEQVGWRGGNGFIPNWLEFIPQTHPSLGIPISSLTPQLQYWAATNPDAFFGATSWFQGILDPVDFIITDPLGRRFGYTAATGLINEIPAVLYSGNANIEQFFISGALPGAYSIELFGLGRDMFAAFGGPSDGTSASGYLGSGQSLTLNVQVDSIPEPTTVLVLLGGVGCLMRRSRRKT